MLAKICILYKHYTFPLHALPPHIYSALRSSGSEMRADELRRGQGEVEDIHVGGLLPDEHFERDKGGAE